MGKLLKSLLVIIITLVIIVALAVGGLWAFCYFKYDVNVFSVASALNKISQTPEETAQVADYESLMTKLNDALCVGGNKVITKDAEDNYKMDYDQANKPLTSDLELTDAECCALFNLVLPEKLNVGGSEIKFSDYDFKLLQLHFADRFEVTTSEETRINNSFRVISSISLIDVKKKMNTFPLSLLKGKVPDTLVIDSTVTISMKKNTIEYTVDSKALNLNRVKHEELKPVFKLINNFIKIGEVDAFNKQIGSLFVNGLLGTSESAGFGYSLVNTSHVATSFEFIDSGDAVKYVIHV